MLTFDPQTAVKADQVASNITETGKYVGVITRAEKLVSKQGTQGLGLSFRSDDGGTADYLDIYTVKSDGTVLSGMKIVQAIMGCLKLREAPEGPVRFSKWNKDVGQREEVTAPGYPALMQRRIGFLLQKVIETDQNGKDRNRIQIFGVFDADTEFTVSEIIGRKTKPEQLEKMLTYLASHQVRDARKNSSSRPAPSAGHPTPSGYRGFDDFQDDIPF